MAPKLDIPRHIEGLPLSVVGPVDLGRLIRELDILENSLQSERLRSPHRELKLPKTSRMLDEVASLNKFDLLQSDDRRVLKEFLGTVKARAPHVHMSFSADPSPLFTSKVLAWVRRQLHPAALLTIGLQPGIGAGCIVRTPNKYFDLSLSKDFAKHRDMLMSALRAAPDTTPQALVASVVPSAAATATSPVVAAAPRTAAPHAKEVHA